MRFQTRGFRRHVNGRELSAALLDEFKSDIVSRPVVYATKLKKREDLRRAQNDTCYLCGLPLFGEKSLDHVKPQSRGGTLKRNALLTHHLCNSKKGNRAPFPCEAIYLASINLIVRR